MLACLTIGVSSVDRWHWCCGGHPLTSHRCTCTHRFVPSAHSSATEARDDSYRCRCCWIHSFSCLCSGFYSCNTEIMPGIYNWTSGVQVCPLGNCSVLHRTAVTLSQSRDIFCYCLKPKDSYYLNLNFLKIKMKVLLTGKPNEWFLRKD